jgi:hypothetical protein
LAAIHVHTQAMVKLDIQKDFLESIIVSKLRNDFIKQQRKKSSPEMVNYEIAHQNG